MKRQGSRPIFLIGYMGSGKSTLGRLVSKATGIDFIDLDAYIVNRFRKTVPELFRDRGEDGFRDIEREMLHEVAAMENVLVACGGGTPCFFDNMDHMNANGTTVWLQAPLQVLYQRLLRGQHKRPLLEGLSPEELISFIAEGLEKRKVHYSKSRNIFNTALLENETDREETAKRFIDEFLND